MRSSFVSFSIILAGLGVACATELKVARLQHPLRPDAIKDLAASRVGATGPIRRVTSRRSTSIAMSRW